MTNEEKKTEKKLKEGKTAARKAAKKKQQIEAKKGAETIMKKMAEELPGAGQGKSFLQITGNIDKLEAERAKINLAIKGERAKLKEMKIELRVYDHVRRLRKMEPEDVKSFKATQALYEEQLAMPLSDDQKKTVAEINQKREDAKKAMADLNGSDAGKEVGSDGGMVGHNSDKAKPLVDEDEESEGDESDADKEKGQAEGEAKARLADPLPSLPERNDAIGAGFRKPLLVAGTAA